MYNTNRDYELGSSFDKEVIFFVHRLRKDVNKIYFVYQLITKLIEGSGQYFNNTTIQFINIH